MNRDRVSDMRHCNRLIRGPWGLTGLYAPQQVGHIVVIQSPQRVSGVLLTARTIVREPIFVRIGVAVHCYWTHRLNARLLHRPSFFSLHFKLPFSL